MILTKARKEQESVWDYPRPPRAEPISRKIRVEFAGEVIAETERAVRVLETSHPPTYYIPVEDVKTEWLDRSDHRTFCEFKGQASYWSIRVRDKRSEAAAWGFEKPRRGYDSIQGLLAFYASRVDACYVDGERVDAQAGDFYGGWVTADVAGPFKGGPGTWGW